MIPQGYLLRHIHATQTTRDIALLDVAQELILAYLEQQGYFASTLVFQGETALRKHDRREVEPAPGAPKLSMRRDPCARGPGLWSETRPATDRARAPGGKYASGPKTPAEFRIGCFGVGSLVLQPLGKPRVGSRPRPCRRETP